MHQMMNNGGMRPSKAMTNILPPVRAASISQIRKNTPIHTVLTEYFPDAFMAIAQQCQQGDTKHNPQNAGNPPFWAREKSKDHLNCVVRHAMTPNRHDEETNLPECVAMAWRALAYCQLELERQGYDWETQTYKNKK